LSSPADKSVGQNEKGSEWTVDIEAWKDGFDPINQRARQTFTGSRYSLSNCYYKFIFIVVWCGVVWCGVVWCGVVRSMAALRGHVEELLGLPYTDSYLHQAKAAIVKQVRTKSVQAGGRKQSWFHLPQPWALFDT
jgi:hypothetical protein